MVTKIAENIWEIEKEGKVYKPLNLSKYSNRDIVSMIPSDRKVAGCFRYSIYDMEIVWKRY